MSAPATGREDHDRPPAHGLGAGALHLCGAAPVQPLAAAGVDALCRHGTPGFHGHVALGPRHGAAQHRAGRAPDAGAGLAPAAPHAAHEPLGMGAAAARAVDRAAGDDPHRRHTGGA